MGHSTRQAEEPKRRGPKANLAAYQRLAEELLKISRRLGEMNDDLIERYSQATQLIQELLEALEANEKQLLILEVRPKAQKFLAAQKAARAGKALQKQTTELRVWNAYFSEKDRGTASRSIRKRIAIDLNLEPQYVGRVLKRMNLEP